MGRHSKSIWAAIHGVVLNIRNVPAPNKNCLTFSKPPQFRAEYRSPSGLLQWNLSLLREGLRVNVRASCSAALFVRPVFNKVPRLARITADEFPKKYFAKKKTK